MRRPKTYPRCSKVGQTPTCLPGAVVAQYRKRGCRTYGPYWFRVWREGSRLRKAYVRREDLEAARAACVAWADRKRARRQGESKRRARAFVEEGMARAQQLATAGETSDGIRHAERERLRALFGLG